MINYALLMKPGIILGNLVTFAAGFLLAPKGKMELALFFETLLGLALMMASGCVFNNCIDRAADAKMERTKKRPLVTGAIALPSAIAFATLLFIAGCTLLALTTNNVALATAALGFIVYVCLYSPLKRKTHYSTLIGSIAGAVPPVVGYTAVAAKIDTAALLLFSMMLLWQMPHFYAIALWHFDDYKKAKLPMLPHEKGATHTKVQMALYIALLLPTIALFTLKGFTGWLFLAATVPLALLWLFLSLRGFNASSDKLWGRQMFRTSLLLINAIAILLPLDKIA